MTEQPKSNGEGANPKPWTPPYQEGMPAVVRVVLICGAVLVGGFATLCVTAWVGLGASIEILYQTATNSDDDPHHDLFQYAMASDLTRTNALGQNALHVAVAFRREAILDELLSPPKIAHSTLDVNAQDKTGLAPLHVAAIYGRRVCAEILLDHGAKIDLRDTFGDTPLHTAAIFGARNVYQFLIERGADPTAKNNDGRTPRDLAVHYGQAEMVAFIDQVSAGSEAPGVRNAVGAGATI